jgi:hypothetical protein
VREFSFHIDPSAKFHKRGNSSGKRVFDFGFLFRLPRFLVRKSPAAIAKPRKRNVQPKSFVRSEPEILSSRQIPYGAFLISTSQLRDGSWIASFGFSDGRLLCAEGKKQAVLVTQACISEPLALTEALMQIDDLPAGD